MVVRWAPQWTAVDGQGRPVRDEADENANHDAASCSRVHLLPYRAWTYISRQPGRERGGAHNRSSRDQSILAF